MPQAEVVVGDITENEVKERITQLSKKAQVNMIIGGPPCQGYSMKGKKLGLKDLSMGMSNDYKIAVECGATMIRIGRKLFEN